MKLVHSPSSAKFRLLLLGYDPKESMILETLISLDAEVWHTSDPILSTSGFDLVISYGFRHIISEETLLSSTAPVINLHISLLPWNRGSHPNFWAHYEGTPSGVSIHLVDAGLDTGPLLYQREVRFSESAITFADTYNELRDAIEDLFTTNAVDILNKKFNPLKQAGEGTSHKARDLPSDFSGWDSIIEVEVKRLRRLKELKARQGLDE